MKKIKDINTVGKKVLVRCDLNVSLDSDGNVIDDLRLREVLATINYLLENRAKIILATHFKEPQETRSLENKEKIVTGASVAPVAKRLSQLIGKEVYFIDDCVGDTVKERIGKMIEGDILLLENLRIYREEKENSEVFGRELASLADVYINDAFSVSHRNHASLTQTPLFVESAAGIFFQQELNLLSKVVESPNRPVVAIIGGAKIESKMKAINYFIENADHLILGGKIANMILIARKIAVNLEKPSDDILQIVDKINYTSPKLHIPVDVITSRDAEGVSGVQQKAPGMVEPGEDIYDIGPETVTLFKDIIADAKTIIWAGPLGLSEVPAFEMGTREVGKAVIRNTDAVKIVGGGDTLKAFKQFDIIDKIDLVSSGGGAMLNFMQGGAMPGVEALM